MTAIASPTQTEPTRAGELGSGATATDTARCPAPSGLNFVALTLADLRAGLSEPQVSTIRQRLNPKMFAERLAQVEG